MITAIALDDEPPALKILENFASKSAEIQLVKTFTRPKEAMAHLKKFSVDLIFLDIQMPSITGIDFYNEIQQDTFVIFTTAYPDYAVEGFNLNAIDYLLKPFTFDRFKTAIKKAEDFILFKKGQSAENSSSIFLRVDYGLKKVESEQIVYMEGLSDYIKIHLEDGELIVVRMTLKNMMDKLPKSYFLRVHRSFIINTNFIKSVRNKVIQMPGIEIPIGRSYEDDFRLFFDKN